MLKIRHMIFRLALTVFALFLNFVVSSQTFTNGQNASHVIGQVDFNATESGTDLQKLDFGGGAGLAVDTKNGKLYISDTNNNRILRYDYPLSADNPIPDLVFGQPDFNSSNLYSTSNSTLNGPLDLAVDKDGNLWVCDQMNNRVLEFKNAYTLTINQPRADVVIGQIDFNSNVAGTTLSTFSNPNSLCFDEASNLWIVNYDALQILRFNAGNQLTGATADGYLGADFTGGTTANTFGGGVGELTSIGSSLFVSDYYNHRVLRFDNAASLANESNATVVLGQTNFTNATFGTSQNTFNNPDCLTSDGIGTLFVGDISNQRVLIFKNATTLTNGANADVVIGQNDFVTNGDHVTQNGISFLQNIGFDALNNSLFVLDEYRVLQFNSLPATPIAIESSNVGDLTMVAKWQAAIGATGYKLDVSTENTFTTGLIPAYTNLDVFNVTTFSIQNLSPQITYYYRVRSYNNLGTNTTSSNVISQETMPNDAGNALDFDGVDDCISSTNSISNPSTFTIEAWFKTSSTSGGGLISFEDTKTGAATIFDRLLWLDPTGHLNFGVAPSGITKVLTSTNTYTDNKWHHVAGSLGVGGQNLYIDGLLVATDPSTTVAQVFTGYWRINRVSNSWNNSGADYFRGQIDEVRIWNTERSLLEIQTNINKLLTGSETDLLTYYNFNEGLAAGNNTQTLVNDLSTSANHGTLLGFALAGSSSNWLRSGAMVLAPIANAATNVTATSFDINWNFVSGVNGYIYDIDSDPLFSNPTSTNAGNANSVSISNLSPNTIYYYRLKSYNNNGNGGFSNTVSQSTIKANQTINFTPFPSTLTYGSAPFSVVASASSGLAVTIASDNLAVASVSGNVVTIVGVGAANITINQAGDASYNSASQVSELISVSPATLTVTANDQSKTYGTSFSFTGVEFSSSGLLGSDNFSGADFTSSATSSSAAVGTYAITPSNATGVGLSNYTITYVDGLMSVSKANQTINLTPFPSTLTYGAAPFSVVASASSSLAVTIASDNLAVASVSGNVVTIVGVGSVNITINQAGDASYNSASQVSELISVSPAALTVTANDQSKTYGTSFSFTGVEFSSSGLLGSDNFSGVDLTSSATSSSAAVGTYAIAPSNATGVGLSNYTITYVDGLMNVSKANQTINLTPFPSTLTYGSAPFSVVASASSGLAVTIASDNLAVASVSGNVVTIVGVGAANITINQAGDASYNSASQVSELISVSPALLTVTANDAAKFVGENNPNLSLTYNGFVGTDSETSLSIIPSLTSTAIQTSKQGEYPISASGGVAANYTFIYIDGNLKVSKKNQILTFQPFANPLKIGTKSFDLNATSNLGFPITYSSNDLSVATISGTSINIVGAGTAVITAIQAGNDFANESNTISQTLTVIGNALSFDGEIGFVRLKNPLTYTPNFTIETWIKPEQKFNKSTIVNTTTSSSDQSGFSIYINSKGTQDGKLHFETFFGDFVSNQSINFSEWHHIAFVVSDLQVENVSTTMVSSPRGINLPPSFKTVSLFVDGTKVQTNNMRIESSESQLTIGGNSIGELVFSGAMDEFQIWNKAKTQSEIQQDKDTKYTVNCGLIVNYHFDQGMDVSDNREIKTLDDDSGNKANGELVDFNLTGLNSNFVTGISLLRIVPSQTISNLIVIGKNNPIDVGEVVLLENGTDLGNIAVNSKSLFSFQIRNSTDNISELSISDVYFKGDHASDFTYLDTKPGSSNSSILNFSFAPSTLGLRNAVLHIKSKACNASDYNFVISGLSVVPISIKDTIVNITTVSAKLTVEINNLDLIKPILNRSFICWSLDGKTTISETLIGDGSFNFDLLNLNPSTEYNVLVYVSTKDKVYYSHQIKFQTFGTISIIDTVSKITSTTANFTAKIKQFDTRFPIQRAGFCWGLSMNPTTADSILNVSEISETLSETIANLKKNTIYHLRAFVEINDKLFYGNDVQFQSLISDVFLNQKIDTISATSIKLATKIINANLNKPILEKGICWSLEVNPSIANSVVSLALETETAFTVIDNLQSNMDYHIRTFAKTRDTIYYSLDLKAHVNNKVSLLNFQASDTSTTSANLQVNCYNFVPENPVIEKGFIVTENLSGKTQTFVIDGNENGIFKTRLTDLKDNTLFKAIAFAKTKNGEYYTAQIYFHTLSTVNMNISAADIKTNSAHFSVEATNNSYLNIAEWGFCWGVVDNPTIDSPNIIKVGEGDANFSTASKFNYQIIQLKENTTYFVRAYAKTTLLDKIQNKKIDGPIYYSNQFKLNTLKDIDFDSVKIITLSASGVSVKSKLINNTSNSITEKGFYYSKDPNFPTGDKTVLTVTVSGIEPGEFNSTINKLENNTIYYIKAFTKYTNKLFFSTITHFKTKLYDCGENNDNLTWEGEVDLTCEITINAKQTLTIKPGTNINFKEGASIIISGNIKADGKSIDKQIIFNHPVINFQKVNSDSSSLFNYCIFENGLDKNNSVITSNSYSNFEISNSIFKNNLVNKFGVIKFYDSSPTITQNTFSNNHTSAIYLYNSNSIISNNTFKNNTTTQDGGAIYAEDSRPIIKNNTITYNKSLLQGGGISFWWCGGEIGYNKITNNQSGGDGGGVMLNESTVLIVGNVIANNTSVDAKGGGLFSDYKTDFYNNTFANNEDRKGGGLSIHPDSKIINCIISGNKTDETIDYAKFNSISNHNYTENNTDFIRPTQGTGIAFNAETADWSLNSTSPCLNAGLIECNIDKILEIKDLLLQGRYINNIDIGAIETKEVDENKRHYIFGHKIDTDETWDNIKYKNTYIVCGDFLIAPAAKLTINAGVELTFMSASRFEIKGIVSAKGTKKDSIVFKIDSPSDFLNNPQKGWNGIEFFQSSSIDSSNFEFCRFENVKNKLKPVILSNANSKIIVKNCKFQYNEATEVIKLENASPNIESNTFYKNRCDSSIITSKNSSNMTFTRNKVSNNTAANSIFSILNASPDLSNNIINNNSYTNLGTFYIENKMANIINNVVAMNAGIAFNLKNTNSQFLNNIIWGNNPESKIQIKNEVGASTFNNNNIENGINCFSKPQDIKSFKNNLKFDPQFIAPSLGAGPLVDTTNTNWSLRDNSQNINAGDLELNIIKDRVDIVGHKRIYHNTRIDIGAYESSFDIAPIDSLALISLYNNTKGENWRKKWDLSKMVNQWFGVGIVGGRVDSLFLHGNNLNGSIPEDIKNLLFLVQVQLYDNSLAVISPVFGELPNLKILNLSRCKLGGSIPKELSHSSNLQIINFSRNKLVGNVPIELGNLKQLILLDLNSNLLSSLPDFSKTPLDHNLQNLTVGDNKLQYGSLELNMGVFPGYLYSPQSEVDEETEIDILNGESITLKTTITGTKNIYSWEKDGHVLLSTNSPTYVINNAIANDQGIYSCSITNSIVDSIVIKRKNITLNVNESIVKRPKIFPLNDYCLGDLNVTLFTEIVDDPTIFWFKENNFKDLLINSYKYRYTLSNSKDSDVVYVARKIRNIYSDLIPVKINIRPNLDFDKVSNIFTTQLKTNYTYQWYFNNQVLEGAKTNKLPLKGDGIYQVKITTPDKTCNSLSKPKVIENGILTALEEHPNLGLTVAIYPNPVTDNVKINIKNLVHSKVTIQIVDLAGRIIKQTSIDYNLQEPTVLDLGFLVPGMYIIETLADNQRVRTQFVKR